jgi:hypothetical protein
VWSIKRGKKDGGFSISLITTCNVPSSDVFGALQLLKMAKKRATVAEDEHVRSSRFPHQSQPQDFDILHLGHYLHLDRSPPDFETSCQERNSFWVSS